MRRIISVEKNDKTQMIKWKMTKWCNYRCSYCIQLYHDNHPFEKIEELLQQAEEINNEIEKIENDKVAMILVGGEVTFFDLKRIFEEKLTSKKIKKVLLTTNFSNKLEYYVELKNYFYERDVELTYSVSIHFSQIADYEEFMKKITALKPNLSIVVNNENIEITKRLLTFIGLRGYKNIRINPDRKKAHDEVFKEEYFLKKMSDGDVRKDFVVTFDDGKIEKMSKEKVFSEFNGNPNFYGYICRGMLSYEKGLKWGVCKYRKELPKGENKEFVVCKAKDCSLCGVLEIKR